MVEEGECGIYLESKISDCGLEISDFFDLEFNNPQSTIRNPQLFLGYEFVLMYSITLLNNSG